MENRKSFIMHTDMQDDIVDLDLMQKGLLFEAILSYHNDKEFIVEDRLVNLILKFYIRNFEKENKRGSRAKRIMINGVEFEGLTHASLYFGKSEGYFSLVVSKQRKNPEAYKKWKVEFL